MTKREDICVVGLGYIGLPTAVVLANTSRSVYGLDVNTAVVDAINLGEPPFAEPDLAEALVRARSSGALRAGTQPTPAQVFILALPTPFIDGHKPDLSYILKATETIAPVLQGDELIILESTSPPGTTRLVAERIFELRPELEPKSKINKTGIDFAHCPERVLPGRIMTELVENDRIVGGLTERASKRAADLYRLFCVGEIVETDDRTAELTKLVENSYRDVNIAFANELSMICSDIRIDYEEVIRLANRHPRVSILRPGAGVGGHCIAVDPWFIVDSAGSTAKLIQTARQVNDRKQEWVANQIINEVRRRGSVRIALLGLSFKPDVDDLRESPALKTAIEVATSIPYCRVVLVEPNLNSLPDSLLGVANVELLPVAGVDPKAFDIAAILVAHKQFDRELISAFEQSSKVMKFC